MDHADFYDLISGRRRGLAATALRGLLACGEAPYAAAVGLRNAWYDHKRSAVTRVEVPVVSVGNLTVGGTGKTPMVKYLARQMRQSGRRVAILSRGYGAEAGAKNDEALELEQLLPDVPHLQGSDRIASARIAIEELESDTLLLDDGFQHRRLGRDLNIVLLDATAPWGFGHLLPRGVLREPIGGLRRAGVVCLTRADAAPLDTRRAIRKRVAELAPQADWCEASHKPTSLIGTGEGAIEPLESLRGRRVAAFCGIGNPAAFRATLESAGAEVHLWRELPDHHNYTADDILSIEKAIGESGVEQVVCTHKDLVKVQIDQLADRPLRALVVEIDFQTGEAELNHRLERALSGSDGPTDCLQ